MAALYRTKKAPRRDGCGAGLVDTGHLRKSVLISGTLLCALIAAAFAGREYFRPALTTSVFVV